MPSLLRYVLVLSVTAQTLAAQRGVPLVRVTAAACPAADSVFGPQPGKPQMLLGVEGSGQLFMSYPTHPASDPYGSITPRLRMAAYPAPTDAPARPAELFLSLSGNPAKKLKEMSSPVRATLILKGDTTVTILGTFPEVTGAPAADMVLAFVSFPFTAGELARLARAKQVKLELGDHTLSIPRDMREWGAVGYRAVLCGYAMK